MDYAILFFAVLFATLEGTHGAAVQEIRRSRPELLNGFGSTGPGYYFFRAYQTSPRYRQALLSGELHSKAAGNRELLRLLTAERLLWYSQWVAVVCVAALVILSR